MLGLVCLSIDLENKMWYSLMLKKNNWRNTVRWIRWTMLEAITRVFNKIFSKKVGVLSSTFDQSLVATMIIGVIQTVVGGTVVIAKRQSLIKNRVFVLGSCLFGVNAFLCTVLPFYIFTLGGDMGINAFIITMSIIPGAFIDRIFFNHRGDRYQWFGILLFVFAGWSILGFPSLGYFIKLPLWIYLSFITMILVAINQGITQKIRDVDPFVKNFWGGFITLFLGVIWLMARGSLKVLTDFSLTNQRIYGVAVVMGLIVVIAWSLNLMSYKGGAYIVLKKYIMDSFQLIMIMVSGVVIFHEPMTIGKIIGVCVFILAFPLMDGGIRRIINSKFRDLV